ncbi:MAG TPA: glycosyltransferase family 9 protein [Chthoniobacterales bacterium]|nr:glycosyltransferase family 9 protein [Chthoniobacterales bacterium]
MNRILVIRGGAIGDFVLTLPALKLLRDRYPTAQIQLLANENIAALAENRFYADAVRSLQSASLAKFFAKDAALPSDWSAYFASFDFIISYLFDPERIFETNLRRAGTKSFLAGPSKLDKSEHAALQLARPLAALGLRLRDPAARLYPSEADRALAAPFAGDARKGTVVLHPGSGSETKNWAIENWRALGDFLLSKGRNLLVISGEADEERASMLESAWSDKPVQFVKNLPLPQIVALLEGSFFIGHDSGISHIAAGVGARCLLLFSTTDPSVWAPANENVTVLRAPEGEMRLLEVESVLRAIKLSSRVA